MNPLVALLLCWILLNLGFIAGCCWAGSFQRRGVRERRSDYEYGIGRTRGTPIAMPEKVGMAPELPIPETVEVWRAYPDLTYPQPRAARRNTARRDRPRMALLRRR